MQWTLDCLLRRGADRVGVVRQFVGRGVKLQEVVVGDEVPVESLEPLRRHAAGDRHLSSRQVIVNLVIPILFARRELQLLVEHSLLVGILQKDLVQIENYLSIHGRQLVLNHHFLLPGGRFLSQVPQKQVAVVQVRHAAALFAISLT